MAKDILMRWGRTVRVDDNDFDWLNSYRWSVTLWYAATTIGGRSVYMHRLIMDPPEGLVVDHRNGDGLDDRRSNLRIVTRSENSRNRLVKIPSRYSGTVLKAFEGLGEDDDARALVLGVPAYMLRRYMRGKVLARHIHLVDDPCALLSAIASEFDE